MRLFRAHTFSWWSKCELAGSPEPPPGITKLAADMSTQVDHQEACGAECLG